MTLCALVTAWASYTLHHDSLTLCDWHHDYSGPLPCCEVWMENCCCNVVFYYVLGPRCSITIDALFQCYFYFSYFVYTIFLISIFVFVFSINSPVFSCCVFGIKCEKKIIFYMATDELTFLSWCVDHSKILHFQMINMLFILGSWK